MSTDTKVRRSPLRRVEDACLVVLLGGLVLFLGLRAVPGSGLTSVDRAVTDRILRLQELERDSSTVAVVMVDDESLSRLGERWPLNRLTWAELLRVIAGHAPAAVAIDAMFESTMANAPEVEVRFDVAEKLRIVGDGDPLLEKFAAKLERDAEDHDGDQQLARALAEGVPAVVGATCSDAVRPGTDAPPGLLAVETAARPSFRCPWLATTHPTFALSAAGQAGLSPVFDGDLRVRRYPYLFRVGDDGPAYQSLAAAAVQFGRPERWAQAVQTVAGLDGAAPMLRPVHPDRIDAVSVWDVLSDPEDEVIRRTLNGRIVFVGTSAQGATDLVTGALGVTMPGVYVHANAVLDLVQDDHVTTDGLAGILGLVGGGGLAVVVLLLTRRVSSVAILFGIASLAAASWAVVAYVALLGGWAVPILAPVVVIGAWVAVRSGFGWLGTARDRAFIRQAFGRYVDTRVVDEILQNEEVKLGGEEREVTVLFSDLRGYSTILENLDPAQAVTLVNQYLGEMAQIVEAHRGTVLEFIGDAVLAVFNAPVDVDDHPRRAVDCALAMRARLAELNAGWERTGEAQAWHAVGLDALAHRIGVHTGPVVAGNLGGANRLKYGVIGDNVNVAARLEALNKQLDTEILLSDVTYRRLPEGRYDGRSQGPHGVKGRQREVEVWSL